MKVLWTCLARDDIAEILDYIHNDNPSTAKKMVKRIRLVTQHLSGNPAIGRFGRVPGTRELVVSGSPYIVPYRVRDNVVEILRVLHSSRKWPGKL